MLLPITFAIRFSGPFNNDIVYRTLRLLQDQFQVLRSGIHLRGDQLYFHEYNNPAALLSMVTIKRKGEDHWKEVMKMWTDKYISISSSSALLWEAIYLEGKEDHELIVRHSHVILDGTSHIQFMHQFFSCAESLIEGEEISFSPSPMIPAQDDLLKDGLKRDIFSYFYHPVVTVATKHFRTSHIRPRKIDDPMKWKTRFLTRR